MRRKSLLAGAIAAAGMLAVSAPVTDAAASTAAASPGAATTTCTFTIHNQTPTRLSGFAFGYVKCPGPFGNGVQSSTYRATINAKTGAATNDGLYTNWFDAGTVYGSFSLRGRYTSRTAATLKGTFTITGGTGAFRGAKAEGTLTCGTANAGATSTCTSVLR